MSLPELESELLGLAGHIAAAECRFLQLLAEFDQRGGWVGDGICSCAHWLSWRAGMNLRAATERLRVAHALQHLPRISEAFGAGRISYSKVRAITRAAGSDTATLIRMAAESAAGESDLRHTTVADPDTAEQVLLNVALCGTASHVETVVRAVRRRHTPPEDTAARRSLTWRWDDNGSLIVRAQFTPDDGAAFIAAIGTLVPAHTPIQPSVEPPPQDLDQRAREQEPGPAADRTQARRADALLAIVHGRTEEDDPVVERGTAQVIVHFDASNGAARIAGGPDIPASTAERLACDARVQLLLDDRIGNRMHMGRSLTDIDNLILVCSFHHGVVHDLGYRIRRISGRWEFLRPDGSPIPITVAPLTGNTESLIEMHTRARLGIDRTTLTPDWDGDRFDPEPILDVLLPKRIRVAA